MFSLIVSLIVSLKQVRLMRLTVVGRASVLPGWLAALGSVEETSGRWIP